ncbi:hypothetical protein R1flu_021922 [Riccia fluitans]|uniref:Uncharacterized protein n=1 Tax=Riccia fluitans TaxID=41844 RepID=A0ABD1ZTV5_9MARC
MAVDILCWDALIATRRQHRINCADHPEWTVSEQKTALRDAEKEARSKYEKQMGKLLKILIPKNGEDFLPTAQEIVMTSREQERLGDVSLSQSKHISYDQVYRFALAPVSSERRFELLKDVMSGDKNGDVSMAVDSALTEIVASEVIPVKKGGGGARQVEKRPSQWLLSTRVVELYHHKTYRHDGSDKKLAIDAMIVDLPKGEQLWNENESEGVPPWNRWSSKPVSDIFIAANALVNDDGCLILFFPTNYELLGDVRDCHKQEEWVTAMKWNIFNKYPMRHRATQFKIKISSCICLKKERFGRFSV